MTKLCIVLSALLYLVLITLALRPGFDLDLASLFYIGPHHFIGDTRTGTIVRYAAWALPFVVMLALLIATALARLGMIPRRAGLSRGSLAFLLASLLVAPGLLVQATLKNVSHRPRPYDVTAFGGPDRFRPFYRFDGACATNCSFPSGEAAAATWMIAPASLVPPPWRGAALAGAVLFAAATGFWRMAFGAHFLSDIAGAALITILVIWSFRSFLRRNEDRP